MAVGIDMFGAGGEGLGGLFVGNQMAMDRDKAEMERQKALVDMANTQQITEQHRLGNEYEGAILGDKIQQFKDAATQKKEEAQLERFNRQGEQFGRLGQVIRGVPGPARQATLRQMATQAGIAEDNPLLAQLMQADPEALPDIMDNFSKGFYEQGEKARAEAQRRELMMEQKKAELAARQAEKEADRTQKAELTREGYQMRRDIAGMMAAASRDNAATRAAARSAGAGGAAKPLKESTDQLFARMVREKMESGEWTADDARQALQEHVYKKAVVGKSETTEDIMGLDSPIERAEKAARGGQAPTQTKAATPAKAAPGDIAGAAKAMGIPYEPDKYEYRIVDGRLKRGPKSQAVPK